MNVGIVAEYNPFHNGHKLQIDYAKNELGADMVLVAMSGSFTQRGEIACFDKYTRAHAALLCGADIIFEIPTVFATASAGEFAAAGVQLLYNTGIVDTILFGAETDDVLLFKDCAKKLVELEISGALDKKINDVMSAGLTFAAARGEALKEHIPAEILNSPNNILGLEYCRYIYEKNLPLKIAIIKRQSNDYNSIELTGDLSSASAIRAHLKANNIITAVPNEAAAIYKEACFMDADDISEILYYKLLSESNYSKYLDCTDDLADRIKNKLGEYTSFIQFCELLKTRNITYSRISRVLCHILLDITKDDFQEEKNASYIRYLRMLGFSKNGSNALGEIKAKGISPIITSPTEGICKADIFSADIVRLIATHKDGILRPTEYTKKFTLNNI